MESAQIRKKFLDFFAKRGHTVVPSSSLIPDDPSVLLTTAGMQQFKPYYTGAADPEATIHPTLGRALGSKDAVSVQKSFRTSDIEEVGDKSHLTFFEMLGNFSFGGYGKKEAIEYAYDFITKELGLEIDYVTIFYPEKVPSSDMRSRMDFDRESYRIWKEVIGLSEEQIHKEGLDNFWGPTGIAGPCGPTTEIYINGVEIWNIVFNQYFAAIVNQSYETTKTFTLGNDAVSVLSGTTGLFADPSHIKGIDTGMGLERLTMVSQNTKSIFETDLFKPFLIFLPKEIPDREKRIIIDHLRGIVFLLADGLRPSNKEAGYILRRLMRRIFVYEHKYSISQHVFDSLVHDLTHGYGDFYSELLRENDNIRKEFSGERDRFAKTLARGLRELEKTAALSGAEAFNLYQTFGLPPEVTHEFKRFSWEEFNAAKKKHLAVSGEGAEKKFGGHGLLLNTGELKAKDQAELEKVTRLHSATHLLQAALRQVLGPEVKQMGSDITAERTRFDFTFPRKLTAEELKKVENIVNEAVEKDLMVEKKTMSYEEAARLGALHFFKEKYPSEVSVYSFQTKDGEVFSRELCGGPHVAHTRLIGKFIILKEEASSAGVRRIRASIVR